MDSKVCFAWFVAACVIVSIVFWAKAILYDGDKDDRE